jgi:TIR domain-containing protein
MPKVFLSYRRSDASAIAGRIFDRLVVYYGREAIFMDVDDVPIGTDFRKHIDGFLHQCDILLAIVGTEWLVVDDSGTPRLRDTDDPVRNELKTALQIGVPIIPVLVDGARMPGESDLPDDLREFAVRNAAEVASGRDFDAHTERLIQSIDRILLERGKEPRADEFTVRIRPTTVQNLPRHHAIKSDKPTTRLWIKYMFGNLVAPVILVILVHYLVVVKLNLNYNYLRAAAILIPLSAGFLLCWYERQGAGVASLMGAAAGGLSVAGMLVIVGLIAKVPVLPATLLDWQESTEYFVSIALSMLMGNVIASLFLKSKLQLWQRRRYH